MDILGSENFSVFAEELKIWLKEPGPLERQAGSENTMRCCKRARHSGANLIHVHAAGSSLTSSSPPSFSAKRACPRGMLPCLTRSLHPHNGTLSCHPMIVSAPRSKLCLFYSPTECRWRHSPGNHLGGVGQVLPLFASCQGERATQCLAGPQMSPDSLKVSYLL